MVRGCVRCSIAQVERLEMLERKTSIRLAILPGFLISFSSITLLSFSTEALEVESLLRLPNRS